MNENPYQPPQPIAESPPPRPPRRRSPYGYALAAVVGAIAGRELLFSGQPTVVRWSNDFTAMLLGGLAMALLYHFVQAWEPRRNG
jgi:hypothetical protein